MGGVTDGGGEVVGGSRGLKRVDCLGDCKTPIKSLNLNDQLNGCGLTSWWHFGNLLQSGGEQTYLKVGSQSPLNRVQTV